MGRPSDFFKNQKTAAIRVTDGKLKTGGTIRTSSRVTDLEQTIESSQVEHENIKRFEAGKDVGINKVKEAVKENDMFYLVKP